MQSQAERKRASITFCSGIGSVTGANFLLESSQGSKILIDCGLIQGKEAATAENREEFIYDPSSIDVLVVTHAHLDHVGRIPLLVKKGFKGKIISTPQTKELAEIVLRDAVTILDQEARREGVLPLFEMEDVDAVFPIWHTLEYHKNKEIVSGVSVYLKDSGHILGSAMIVFDIDGKKVMFTGDLGNSPAPLLRDTESVDDVDYLIMESVYGDRNHEPKNERDHKLEKIIREAIGRGGSLVIPAFAIDRTQTLLFEINNMVEKNRIPLVPIFVDSPMATKATRIYESNPDLFNDAVREQIRKGDNIFSFPKLKFTSSPVDSRNIEHVNGAKIILAGSGMSVGGRVVGHEEQYLPDPKNTILFVGYQSPGSLGRQLSEGAKKVDIHGRTIRVKAHIEKIFGYSAHKDSDNLVKFASTANQKMLQNVFVAMGEPKASMHLTQRLNDELGINASIPERGVKYFL